MLLVPDYNVESEGGGGGECGLYDCTVVAYVTYSLLTVHIEHWYAYIGHGYGYDPFRNVCTPTEKYFGV